MIPLILILAAMIAGFIAPQIEKHEAMKGVFTPTFEVPRTEPELIEPKHVSPLKGNV